jgi:hypothetical protein
MPCQGSSASFFEIIETQVQAVQVRPVPRCVPRQGSSACNSNLVAGQVQALQVGPVLCCMLRKASDSCVIYVPLTQVDLCAAREAAPKCLPSSYISGPGLRSLQQLLPP